MTLDPQFLHAETARQFANIRAAVESGFDLCIAAGEYQRRLEDTIISQGQRISELEVQVLLLQPEQSV